MNAGVTDGFNSGCIPSVGLVWQDGDWSLKKCTLNYHSSSDRVVRGWVVALSPLWLFLYWDQFFLWEGNGQFLSNFCVICKENSIPSKRHLREANLIWAQCEQGQRASDCLTSSLSFHVHTYWPTTAQVSAVSLKEELLLKCFEEQFQESVLDAVISCSAY